MKYLPAAAAARVHGHGECQWYQAKEDNPDADGDLRVYYDQNDGIALSLLIVTMVVTVPTISTLTVCREVSSLYPWSGATVPTAFHPSAVDTCTWTLQRGVGS